MADTNKPKLALAERTLIFGDDYSVPVAKLNDEVRFALMQRTFAHIMGNEAASVLARNATYKNEEGREVNRSDAELTSLVHDWRMAKIEAMAKGKFSLRVAGPKLTSDERQLREIARDQIIAQATKAKRALPKASDKETWDKAIENFLATPRLRAVADAELARRKAFSAPVADMDELFA